MKKLACLTLLVAAALMAGCMYGATDECCGEYEANCCGWEFYKPCDLIEGKRADCNPDPCAGAEIVHEGPPIAPPVEAPVAPPVEEPAEAPAEAPMAPAAGG